MNITATGKLAKKYLKKYPNLPILTIAKLMHSENDMHFNSVDHARSSLKRHAGLSGPKSRKNADPEIQRKVTYNYAPFNNIPKSFKSGPNDFTLPRDANHILLLSDIHFPYHDEEALAAAIQYGMEKEINTVLLNGDILDFYQLSRFDKDPSKPKMKVELEQGRWFMKALREAFPNARIYYKIGNHEDRLEKWLRIKAPEWIGTEEFELKMLLRFGENQIQLIDSEATIKVGNLNIIHGHEYIGGGTVNPARNLYLKAKASTICGHFHRKSEFTTRDINNKIQGAWTTGCLCELYPEYMKGHSDWVHGFAVIKVEKDGNFSVENKMIIDGVIV
jgi:predicted phosphodiesterase